MLTILGTIALIGSVFGLGAYWGKKKIEHGVFNESKTPDAVSLWEAAATDAKQAYSWVTSKTQELKTKVDESRKRLRFNG